MKITVVGVLALLCAVIYVAEAQDLPQIVDQILPEIKRLGMSGYLNCTVARKGNNKVYWIHKDSNTVLTSDDKVELDFTFNEIIDGFPKYDIIAFEHDDLRNKITFTLIVRRLQLIDSGQYTCQVLVVGSGGNDQTISKSGNITVLVPPTISQSETTQTLRMEEYTRVELTCGAYGYPHPNISWVRANGKKIPEPVNQIAFRGGHLILNNVTRGDRGVYRCVADNAVRPPATYDTTIYIEFRPFSRYVQDSYGQAQNRLFDLTIECVVSGFPEPDMRWYKVLQDGLRAISDDDKHVIHAFESHGQALSVNSFWFQLTIINVQANDYGDYVCEGINKAGSHRTAIHVYETSECQGAVCPFVESVGVAGSSPLSSWLPTHLLAICLGILYWTTHH